MWIPPNSTVMRCFCWFFNPDAQSMPHSTTYRPDVAWQGSACSVVGRRSDACGGGRALWLSGTAPIAARASHSHLQAMSAARFAWRTPRLAVWDARGTRPKARVAFLRERDWFVVLRWLSTRNDSWAVYRRPVRVSTSTLLFTVTCPSYLRVEPRSAEPPPQHRFPSSRFKAEGRIQMLASCI